MPDAIPFVLGSSARRAVLARLADGPARRPTVVAECDASESAVYDGLVRLAERDLVTEDDDGEWRLTGSGRLIADAVAQCHRVEALVDVDPDYWATHDLSGLPERFRRSLDAMRDCEVVRSPETDPFRAVRRSETAIREGDSVAVVAPIYSDRHATAYVESEATDRRLVLTPETVARLLEDEPRGPDADGQSLSIRVHPASLSLTVTDEVVLLSLPDCGGVHDTDAVVVAEAERALEWGRECFEYYWQGGTPVEEWIATNDRSHAAPATHAHGQTED